MSASLKNWLWMLLIWFLFALFAFHSCVNKCCVKEEVEEVIPTPAPEVQRYPIDFQWNNAQVHTNEGYEAIRDRLASEMSDDNQLVITGKYFASETAPEGFASMGLARAAAFRDLLPDSISRDRITLTDLKLNDSDSAKEGYFESLDFEWQEADAEEEAEIIELSSDEIAIRFPFSSSTKDADPTVDDYLTTLAARMAQTTERVRITGHTDNIGSNDMNMKLSERRAKYIRDILSNKGVALDRMDVDWKGENEPTSSNDTEEGRHNNRRVVLKVLK